MSSLFAFPKQRALDNSGRPIPGARLYFYINLTSTPKNVYSDAATNTPHTNPVIADSHGQFPAIWLDGVYTVKLTTSANVEQWTVDDVSGPDDTIFPETENEEIKGIPPVDTDYWAGDLRRLGALGDDPAADSEALQNALILGGDIYVAKGYDFDCSGVVQHVVAQDIRIYGGGTLSGLAGTYLLKPAGGNIVVEDVIFDTWGGLVRSDHTDNAETTDLMRIQNAQFYNMSGMTIDHERPLNNFIFEDNILANVTGESVRVGWNDYASQDNWEKITIRNNRWTTIRSTGDDIACAALINGVEVDIEGNYVYDVYAAGTGEAHGFYWKARKATVSRNKIILVLSATGDAARHNGLNGKGTPRGSTGAPQGFNTIVTANYVERAGGYGIRVQSDEANVGDNIIEEPGDSAISLDAVSGDNIVVHHNKGYTTSSTTVTATPKVGIRCAWNGSRVNLSDNTMEGFANGCLVSIGAGETLSGLKMHDNTFNSDLSAGYGIHFSLNATATLTNPELHHNKVQSASWGIQMPGAGTTTGMVVEHNDLRGATTKINGSIPSGTVVRFNPGYVTSNGGTSTGKATGGTIAHGLVAAPTSFFAIPQATAATDVYVTADATNLTVTFGGGGTVAFAWEAKTATFYG